MAENELTLSARVRELEAKAVENAEIKGQMSQINQAIAQGNRMTIWQFISFTLVMAGTFIGTLTWVSATLREENRQTREQLQRQIEQTERNLNERFNERFAQMEKRFEDLREVVLSQQKQAAPQR